MAQPNGSKRLESLDALRGFDMFWIMGAGHVFRQLDKATGSPFWHALGEQTHHVIWHGFVLYDLIFPLFLFLAGVATPYSLGKKMIAGANRSDLLLGIVKRGLILVLLGVVHENGLQIRPLDDIRFASVLGRIGLAYMFASFIYLYTKQRGQVIWCASLLIGYWLLLLLGSAPEYPRGDLSMQGNIVSYLDRVLLPGKLYLGIHDPEGVMATIPAISTALFGILAGSLLKNTGESEGAKTTLRLALAGAVLLVLAQIWNLTFPINKNLWTSSFALQCGGLSLLLLAVFYYVIDVKGYRKGAFFFKVIGMNSILIYMSSSFINWNFTAHKFFGWLGELVGEPYELVVMTVCIVGVQWAFLFFLYRHKVFLRI